MAVKHLQIETLFIGCKGKKDIPKLLSEIGSRISSQSFVDEWYLYCRSATASFNIDSNTQKSINVEKLFTNLTLDKEGSVTNGTKIHGQEFSNLCHSFAIVTSLRRELANVMNGKSTTNEKFKDKTPLEVLD